MSGKRLGRNGTAPYWSTGLDRAARQGVERQLEGLRGTPGAKACRLLVRLRVLPQPSSYVIGEIWYGMRRFGHRELGLVLLACGFAAGVITDFLVVYGGG